MLADDPLVGQQIGRFRIASALATGGMGRTQILPPQCSIQQIWNKARSEQHVSATKLTFTSSGWQTFPLSPDGRLGIIDSCL